MSDRELMRQIAGEVLKLEPGKWLDVSSAVLDKIGTEKLCGPFGPTWLPEEWVMENVPGSSWCVEMVKDPSSGTVTFKKLMKPSETRTYISPDRR